MNFPFLGADVPRSTICGVYISEFIRFARLSSHVNDFNTRNKVLTAKLFRKRYRYHKIRKGFGFKGRGLVDRKLVKAPQ